MTAAIAIPDQKPARRLKVQDTHRRHVVAVIELLSPSNKDSGPDRDRYLDKRFEVLSSDAALVEIDLLRGGPRLPIQGLPACSYYALVSRPGERPDVGLWPLGLPDRLPVVPIPLRPGEPEPTVDLQAVLDRVYDEGGYPYRIYDGEPDPPLSAADAEWAQRFAPSDAPGAGPVTSSPA